MKDNKLDNIDIDLDDELLSDDDLLSHTETVETDLKDDGIEELDDDSDDNDGSRETEYVEDEADEAFAEQEKNHRKSNLFRRIILVVAAIIFIYAAYNLVHIFLEYKKGDDIYNAIENDVLQDETQLAVITDTDGNEQEVEAPFVYNHASLLSINPEGLGYLYIPSINVRLPMVQSTDNDFYLTHTFDKSYNGNGCLFEDYRITGGLSASHVIIYGHNMNNGAMFGNLAQYKNSSFYYANNNNPNFYIYTENKIMQYKIFSVYTCEPISDTYTFNFGTLDAMRSYASRMKAQSDYDTGISVDQATQVVTFSTCTNNSKQRFIVQGVYVGEASLEQ